MPKAARAARRGVEPAVQGGKQGKAAAPEAEEIHEEAANLFEADREESSVSVRRSGRRAAAATGAEEEEDEKAAIEAAVRVAKSIFPCPPEAVQVYDVEGRGSCGPFALAVSMGFKLGHAAVAGDELKAKVKKVTAKDRYIDLQLRWGAHEIVNEHYKGGKEGAGFVSAANGFSPDLVHKVTKMTTKEHGGAWVSYEWLGFMAAFAGLRYLYVVNVDNKAFYYKDRLRCGEQKGHHAARAAAIHV